MNSNPFDNLFENKEVSGTCQKLKADDREAKRLRRELQAIKNQLKME